MKIKLIHPNAKMPTYSTSGAGAADIFMPESGQIRSVVSTGLMVPLGFSAEVPAGHVALLLPRSGTGAKNGLSLNNTVGVIDSDYRGEWVACLRLRNFDPYKWDAGDRLLQFIVVPVISPEFEQVEELSETTRGAGGFGSTGGVKPNQ